MKPHVNVQKAFAKRAVVTAMKNVCTELLAAGWVQLNVLHIARVQP